MKLIALVFTIIILSMAIEASPLDSYELKMLSDDQLMITFQSDIDNVISPNNSVFKIQNMLMITLDAMKTNQSITVILANGTHGEIDIAAALLSLSISTIKFGFCNLSGAKGFYKMTCEKPCSFIEVDTNKSRTSLSLPGITITPSKSDLSWTVQLLHAEKLRVTMHHEDKTSSTILIDESFYFLSSK